MKLKKEYLPHYAMGDYMLIPTGKAQFQGVVKGNETFGKISQCLKHETDEAGIVQKLVEIYGEETRADIERDVREALRQLREIGAIEESAR